MNDKNEHALSDHQLIDRVLNVDVQYFKSIIKMTERLVAQIVFKMIANGEDRKDISQDIYLKAYNGLGNFNFKSKLSTWVGQIAYNTCLNYIQRKKLVLIEGFSDDDDDVSINTLQNKISDFGLEAEPEALLTGKELSKILGKEVDKLSVIYKTLITLYHTEGLSYAEIGEITHLPEGTVKNYLFRARKTLKENLLLKYKKEDL